MTSGAVSDASKLPPDLLNSVEATPTALSRGKVVALAKALAVPTQFLFFKNLEIEQNLPDFRTVENRPAILTSAGLSRVERARSIVAYLNDDIFETSRDASFKKGATVAGGVAAAADTLRTLYKKSTRPDGSVDPVETFRETRVSVEREGAIVLCDRVPNDSFRGFCLSQKGHFPLILINTANQRPATKLFTLMHEVVHVMLGRSGVSDPTMIGNKIEQFCNRVTAAVTMPKAQFSSLYADAVGKDVRTTTNALAYHFGVSKQAAALRVTELKLDERFYSKWVRALPPRIPAIEEEDEKETGNGKGGGIPAQISRFGYLLPKVLGGAVNRKTISNLDAYRLTNLKPQTFEELSRIGKRRLES